MGRSWSGATNVEAKPGGVGLARNVILPLVRWETTSRRPRRSIRTTRHAAANEALDRGEQTLVD
ncbi:MAG TPA: hypothetical protein VGP03_02265 [Pseudonocardiaceae bacterium]|nr:hypothetical protein [Pseudonocardiaceae bacterium]